MTKKKNTVPQKGGAKPPQKAPASSKGKGGKNRKRNRLTYPKDRFDQEPSKQESAERGEIVRQVRKSSTGMIVLTLILLALFGSLGYYVYNDYDEAVFLLNKFLYALRWETPPRPSLKPARTVEMPLLPMKPSKYPHLKFGMPGNAKLMDWPGFAVGYHTGYKQPAWVMYRITKQTAAYPQQKPLPLHSCREKGIVCAEPTDYRNSKFTPALLAPAGDMCYSQQAFFQAHDMLNTAPMHPSLKQNHWNELEKQVRFLLQTEPELYIISGTIFSVAAPDQSFIGKHQVPVPSYFYKIIYSTKGSGKMLAFRFPNDKSCETKSLWNYASSISDIEKITDLRYFNTLPESTQKRLKQTFSLSGWYWDRR